MGTLFSMGEQLPPPITTVVDPLLRIASLRSDTEDRRLLIHFSAFRRIMLLALLTHEATSLLMASIVLLLSTSQVQSRLAVTRDTGIALI